MAEKDPIQEFLKNTGWSRDDLLEKLQKLRSEETVKKENGPLLKVNTKPFTDTDDEEKEAHVTNNSIFNEIINDISTVNTRRDSGDGTPIKARETNENETSEIMEVRVIEVNNEDDDFEEEYSSKLSSDNFQYLETYPRKSFCQGKSVIGSKRPSEETNELGKIEYVETYPRKRIKVLCLEKEISEFENDKQVHHTEIFQTELNELCEVPSIEDDNNPIFIPYQFQEDNEQTEKISREIKDKSEKSTEVQNDSFNDNTIQLQDQIQPPNINQTEAKTLETSSYLGYKEISKNERNDENNEDISDLNSSASSFDNESVTEDDTVSSENVENIRTNLKLQLSSLRTRKKEQFIQPQTKIVDSIECNKKLLNIIARDDDEKKTDNIDTSVSADEKINNSKQLREKNQLFLQTNELGFVISDVKGGVEFDEKENNEKNLLIKKPEDNSVFSSNNFEKDIDDSQYVVLDQIRKIISKQKCSLKPNEYQLKSNSDSSQVHVDLEKKDNKIATFIENSQSSFSDKTREFEKKSPFVSDSLDEFLVGNSKLNISYMVPKCGAEEGLKENLSDDGPLLLKQVCKLETLSGEKPKKSRSLKAKTVAQKRKLLEREKKREQKKLEKLKKINLFPKKEKSVELSKELNRSFVLFNNEKLWVKSEVHDKCIANIGCKNLMKGSSPINTRRKFSLLAGEKKNHIGVKYLPGPLCKKTELQITGHSDWETHFKTLPEISLEVVPTTGLRLPDHIIDRLKIFDGQLDSGQIEFALSALKTKSDNNLSAPKSFKFPLKYHNEQERVIVRKRKLDTICYTGRSSVNKNENSRDTVADVIDDLIRYVEIREIAPTLIKDDESQIKNDGILVEKLSPIIDSNVSIFKKPHKKKTKVEQELLRLNCKLVNVEVEENQSERNCEKPHCHLGCVCKSLKCENILNYHCQLPQCMFNCTCPKEKDLIYEHSLTLPAGTDLLSSDTVNRIEDETKKNLAKEEREFTQTVIHTKNETIVVGLGRRSKLRRNTKTPAKYSDFVDSGSDAFFTQLPDIDFSRKCTVSLPRLNLLQIIPYCLMHNLYDCYCEGKSPFISNKEMNGNIISEQRCEDLLKVHGNFTEKIVGEEQNKLESPKELCKPIKKLHLTKHRRGGREESETRANNAVEKSKTLPKHFNEAEDVNPNEDSHNTSDNTSSHIDTGTNILSNSKRPMRNKRKKDYDSNYIEYSDEILHEEEPDDCARTRGLPPEYPKTETVSIKEQKNDFSYNIKESDVFRAKLQYMNTDMKIFEADILKKKIIEQYMGNILFDKVKSKRKQTLSVRRENSTSTSTSLASFHENGALQRRNKLPPGKVKVQPVFDGEIIVDKNNLELLKKIGPKTVHDGYARLLPWKVLIKNFETGKINIWSMVNRPSRLLINKINKKAPKNYVDIKTLKRRINKKTTEEKTEDVISWILHGRLPDYYPPDSVSFILKEIKNNFEICGVCTRKFNKEDLASRETEEKKTVDNSKNKDFFDHRDLSGNYQTLNIFKKHHKLQELVEESTGHLGEMSVDKDKLYMWAALPEIHRVCKWRMINLNSDFTYLYFVSIDYSIRYTDLVRIGRIARDNKCTVKVTNDTLKNGYDHVEFGIYFDQSYNDRIFIGPYFKQYTGHDVETYRYVNKSLISTEDFNKMTGKNDYKCGHWLIERPYSRKRYPEKQLNISTIDLTSEGDRSNVASKVLNSLKKPTSKDLPHTVIMHNEEQILILDAPPRKPEDFNLYIISNIPHLGYLGAFKHSSGKIDVSWPFEEKLLRFSNTSVAVDFLQERFSALLQPVPETFKINIITVTQIDFPNCHPIDATVLSGQYICGDFGFENITTMTNDDCLKKLGKSRNEILSMFSKRAKLFLGKRIESLASLLYMGGNSGYDISKILNAATEEIHALVNQEKQNIDLKHKLLVMKRSKAIKLFAMIEKLPCLQRNIESMKFRSVLFKTEPIEIQDSDEEESRDAETNKNQNLTKTSPSESSNPDVLKNQNLTKTSPSEFSNPDVLKLLKPQPCLLSSPEVKKQRVLPSPPNSQQNNLVSCSSIASTSAKTTKQTSLLKPLVRVPITHGTSLLARGTVDTSLAKNIQGQTLIKNPELKTAKYISGVKLVKSSSGNFVLVPDESPQLTRTCTKPGLASGTRVIIQNNKIKSLKKFESEEVQAMKLRKVNGEGLKVVSNKLVDCQVIDADTDLDSLNTNDTLIIDLDAENEIDNMLIQNDLNSVKTTSNSYNGINENMEIKTSVRYENSDNSESITIIEDDILSDTEENFQNTNSLNSQFVNSNNKSYESGKELPCRIC